MSERSHHHNPAAHSRFPDARERGGPSLTHRPYPTANPAISIASMPRQRWVPNRGKQTAAPLSSEKRDRRERSFLIENSSQCTQIAPSKTSRACSSPKQKTQRSCVSSGQITRTRIHTTISNALLVLAMINKGKLYSYQNARFFKQTSQWRRKSWWCNLPAALILWHAGSDVMGCRRPTGGVFTYVSSDTSHAEGVPRSPLGTQFEFPWRGTVSST